MTVTDLRHRAEYAVVLALRAVVAVLPDAGARALGTLMGLAFYLVDHRHRRVAVQQLRSAFPTRSAAECRAIARATFAHFGRLLVSVLRLSTIQPDQLRAQVEIEGENHLREALALGRGVLVVTGHFGLWEVQGVAHPLFWPRMNVLARPLDNPYLQRFLERTRESTGNRVVYRQGGLRRALRALSANETVAMLIDQHIQPSNAVFVDFFNRPAATTTAAAVLAIRTGAPLVPIFALPLPGGRVRLVYEHPVLPPPPDAADPVAELTQRCTDVLEMYVRRHPHLWLWMHRRWRDGDDRGDRGMFPKAAGEVEGAES
ncbi:MAG TPA: lysophospholipid acyltransferase family protein [Vicinamibacterales bacterium]|nr:lysophospholipid acyltransferase family protein [Vicinamibacterales bacterium]